MLDGMTQPLSGASVGGFTSPTYTHTADAAPSAHADQVAVSSLGGTQGSASAHSVSSPFTITVERPATLRQVGQPNPVTGTLSSVPINVYKVRTRKGMVPLAGQAAKVGIVETKLHVPAGADTASPDDLLAAISAHIGALSDLSDEIATLAQTGILG